MGTENAQCHDVRFSHGKAMLPAYLSYGRTNCKKAGQPVNRKREETQRDIEGLRERDPGAHGRDAEWPILSTFVPNAQQIWPLTQYNKPHFCEGLLATQKHN